MRKNRKNLGNLEKESSLRTKRKKIRLAILGTVAALGLVSMALMAPNAIQALAKMGIIDTKGRRKEYINRSRDRLIGAGLLKRNNKGYLEITDRGEMELRKLQLENYRLKQPRRWDKKWRVLIFDIPEYRRSLREKVRRTLRSVGFLRLQDSVWLYPYPCEDLVALLKADFKIGKDIIYIITDSIEYDKNIRKQFNLTVD